MGKKKQSNSSSLGHVIIKDRFSKKRPHRTADTFLHTTELSDGYDWARLNLQSVTEQNQLDDFLATAELAGTEFTAEKLNIQIVSGQLAAAQAAGEMLSDSEMKEILAAQDKHKNQLRIPRRPLWNTSMSAEELEVNERESFLEWRKSLAMLQEQKHILITPFERNLEFWRQLWRVIERSHVVVQIVDGRNPLLFRCEDLEKYVKEVDCSKVNAILINKSDYLTDKQRCMWADFFNKQQIKVFFWSALLEAENQNKCLAYEHTEGNDDQSCSGSSNSHPPESVNISFSESMNSSCDDAVLSQVQSVESKCEQAVLNTAHLCRAEELIQQLKSLAPADLRDNPVITIGMVGYPNVGKSSTINALLHAKKVPVSATPGRTKHFQTVFLDATTMLCDCPGLVMPSFVSTKSEMLLNGILPIDQMREHRPAVNLLCRKIPRNNLELTYSINIRKPKEGEDPDRPPTDLELLNAYGAMRGFMTASGTPDGPRSARVLLKDFVNGKLLYCEPPPGVDVKCFEPTPHLTQKPSPHEPLTREIRTKLMKTVVQVDRTASQCVDRDFFKQATGQIHAKGKAGMMVEEKLAKRHGNRNKREKVRRLYKHLDKHDAY